MRSCTQCKFSSYRFETKSLSFHSCNDRWGQPFLQHTFLYHIHRLDHRHNFSLYFYPIYLSSTSPSNLMPSSLFSFIMRHPLTSFVPQLILSIGLGFIFGHKDLAFAWFVQTVAFVTFNKVCTSQVSSTVFASIWNEN